VPLLGLKSLVKPLRASPFLRYVVCYYFANARMYSGLLDCIV